MSRMHGYDRFLAPATIVSGTNSYFRLVSDPTGSNNEVVISLDSGDYWPHSDNSFSSYPSLYGAIAATLKGGGVYGHIISGSALNFFDVKPATPANSPNLYHSGISFLCITGSFTIDFSDSEFTMDARWFGHSQSTSTGSHTGSAGQGELSSSYSCLGIWEPYSFDDAFDIAVSKLDNTEREQYVSHGRMRDAYQLEWNTDVVRQFKYDYIPSVHVKKNRAINSNAASLGRIGTNDVNNTFEEFWLTGSRLADIIVIHDRPILSGENRSVDLQVDSHLYEVIRFNNDSQRKNLNSCITLRQMKGEFYTIEFDGLVIEGNYKGIREE